MSKTIDQRVVEMQFDNKQFERNVSTTMSSVDKLKQKLNFDGVSKGFDNIFVFKYFEKFWFIKRMRAHLCATLYV